MDRNDETSFCEKFQDASPEKVSQLRQAIRQDVKETDGQIIIIWSYNKFLASFLPLVKFPEEFGQLFKDKYVDLDMQDDLERTEIINWCRTTNPVLAIRTTADGNCLLHAVSQGMWGVEDTELFLRRLLYVNLVTDPKGAFKKRWMFHQRNSSDLHRIDVRLNTVECSEEWESVIKATDDLGRSQSHGLPYTALESIHLYVSANMLRRPIIVLADTMARTVYGETIQDSQISGIYLPLEWPPEQCDKNPLVLGYNMNHFAPLLFEEDISPTRGDATVRGIPLVTKDMDSVPARYLMPNEEVNYSNILRDYVNTTEVFYGTTSIPAAKVTLVPLPETVNIVDACRKDCERKFRRLMDPDPERVVPPFNFQVANREPSAPVHRRQLADHPPERLNDGTKRKRCATIGCELFANPETQNLCSKCFNDFTIQYARQEEAARKMSTRRPVLPTQTIPFGQTNVAGMTPARQGSSGENFHDLSMMGEDCYAGCGFKCSTETYPYCHECHPKYVKTGTVAQQPQQAEPQGQPVQQEYSMMPETCHNPNCSYRCSKATYPYCHGCFPKFGSPAQAAPTAPPPSVPMAIGSSPSAVPTPGSNVGVPMRIQSSDETIVVSGNRVPQQFNRMHINTQVIQNQEPERQTEPMDVQIGSGALNKKCITLQCNNLALKGNNGYCDTCYQLTLFGGGNSPGNMQASGPAVVKCKTPGCNEDITVPEATQCIACFLKGDRSQFNSLTGSRTQTVAMNIVPTSEEKILNSGRPGTAEKAPVFSLAGASMRSMPTEHDETAAQVPVIAPVTVGLQVEQEQKYQNGERVKYICATPGCEGIRTNTDQGLCYTCMRNVRSAETAEPQPPSGSNLEESAPYSSCSPVVLSKEEMKKLNPVVVSSRDKVVCASPHCDALIYPPKKLCDTCSAVLQRFQAEKAKEDNRKSVGSKGAPCKTMGCTFFGSPQTNGYCSSCFKAQVPPTRHTAPLANRTRHTTNTAPLQSANQPTETRHTVPIVAASTSRAKQCIEKDCTRYGDPNQLDRCSYHFEKAISQFPPMSPASLEQNLQIIAQQQQPQQAPTANRHTSRNRIESSGHHHRKHRPEVVPSQHHGTSQAVAGGANVNQQVVNGSPTDDPFEQSYNKLLSSKKSSGLCKNNSRTGCSNFGNSSNSGYCNTCYLQLQRTSYSGQNGFR